MHKHLFSKAIIYSLGFVIWTATSLAADAPYADVADDYKVNAGDVIRISVWREDGMDSEVLVRPDGKFSFPLAGDVIAKGRSIEQIRETLTERLSKYIPDLVVSVSATQLSGNKIYIIGQVSRPGEIIVNPQIDIMQALAIAGGTTTFANYNDIKILRRTAQGLITIPFRYGDLESGKKLDQNIMLKAGDVVIVP